MLPSLRKKHPPRTTCRKCVDLTSAEHLRDGPFPAAKNEKPSDTSCESEIIVVGLHQKSTRDCLKRLVKKAVCGFAKFFTRTTKFSDTREAHYLIPLSTKPPKNNGALLPFFASLLTEISNSIQRFNSQLKFGKIHSLKYTIIFYFIPLLPLYTKHLAVTFSKPPCRLLELGGNCKNSLRAKKSTIFSSTWKPYMSIFPHAPGGCP